MPSNVAHDLMMIKVISDSHSMGLLIVMFIICSHEKSKYLPMMC